MDLKSITSDYKEFTQALDLAVLLINKTIPIINDKVKPELGDIKNYTSFLTSFNLILASALHINYNRKTVLRELHEKKDSEYINKKIKSINENYEIFIRELKSVINALTLFKDAPESDQGAAESVRNIADLKAVLNKLYDNIEKKFYVKVGNDNKIILESVSKTGSGETVSPMTNEIYRDIYQELTSIKGGAEKTEVYVAGKCYIGGNIADTVKNRIIRLDLLKNDATDNKNNEIIAVKFDELLPAKYLAAIKDGNMYAYLANNTATNFIAQLEYMTSTFLMNLQEYLMQRLPNASNKQAGNNIILNADTFSINSYFTITITNDIKLILAKSYRLPDQLYELYVDLLALIKQYLNLINDVDKSALQSTAENTFAIINETTNPDDLAELYQKNLAFIKDAQVDARFAGKTKIFQDYRDLCQIKQPLKKVRVATFNTSLSHDSTPEKIKLLMAVIHLEKSLLPELQKQEAIFNVIANKLNLFTLAVEDFISIDNGATCIKKPAAYIQNLIIYAMSRKLSKKRWGDKSLTLPVSDMNKLKVYNAETGFNVSSIDKEIQKICCPVFSP